MSGGYDDVKNLIPERNKREKLDLRTLLLNLRWEENLYKSDDDRAESNKIRLPTVPRNTAI